MSATFGADALLAIGMEPSVSPSVRLVMLAAERADRAGVATFDPDELRDLLGNVEMSTRPESKAVQHALWAAAKSIGVLSDSNARTVRLDPSLIQPEGFPEVGARYGGLVLVHEVDTGKWLCACDCGSRRTYMLPYLESGITSSCGQHRPVNMTEQRESNDREQ